MFRIKLGLTSPIDIKISYTKYFIGRQNVANLKTYKNVYSVQVAIYTLL